MNQVQNPWIVCDKCNSQYSKCWGACRNCQKKGMVTPTKHRSHSKQRKHSLKKWQKQTQKKKITYKMISKPPPIPYVKQIVLGIFIISFCLIFAQYNSRKNLLIFQSENRIQLCKDQFQKNKCHDPLPALKDYCFIRQSCMNKDPLDDIYSLQIILLTLSQGMNNIVKSAGIPALAILILILYILRKGEVKNVEVIKTTSPKRRGIQRPD